MGRKRRIRHYQQIASKLLKTRVLEKTESLRPFLPETRLYSADTLEQMLQRYPTVYVKPDKGGGGGGILRVRKREDDKYEICFRTSTKITNRSRLDTRLRSCFLAGKRYLIQQGIDLVTIDHRPFDFRLLLQRPGNEWELTGIVAKAAAPGRIVTNHCKGGVPVDAISALWVAANGDPDTIQRWVKELVWLGIGTADALYARFTGLRELGIDVGLDRNGRFWIFEVNTRPQFRMFKKIGDRSMYRKIMQFHSKIV
jgi:YheC/D like ATP-grasp